MPPATAAAPGCDALLAEVRTIPHAAAIPRVVRRLRSTGIPPADCWTAIAAHAPVGPGQVDAILARPAARAALPTNDRLGQVGRDALLDALLDRFERAPNPFGRRNPLRRVMALLTDLAQAGWFRPEGAPFHRLLRTALPPEQAADPWYVTTPDRHPVPAWSAGEDTMNQECATHRIEARRLVLHCPELSQDTFTALLDTLGPGDAYRMLTHPCAGLAVWRAIGHLARQVGRTAGAGYATDQLVEDCITHRPAHASPEIRAFIAERWPALMDRNFAAMGAGLSLEGAACLAHGDHLLRTTGGAGPYLLTCLLAYASEDTLRGVGRAWIQRLCLHHDEDVREFGRRILPMIGPRGQCTTPRPEPILTDDLPF